METPPREGHPWSPPRAVRYCRPPRSMPPHGEGVTRPPTEHCQPRSPWQTRRPSHQTQHSLRHRHGQRLEWLRHRPGSIPPQRQRRPRRRPLAVRKLPALRPLNRRQPPPPNRQKCQRQPLRAQTPWWSPSSPPLPLPVGSPGCNRRSAAEPPCRRHQHRPGRCKCIVSFGDPSTNSHIRKIGRMNRSAVQQAPEERAATGTSKYSATGQRRARQWQSPPGSRWSTTAAIGCWS